MPKLPVEPLGPPPADGNTFDSPALAVARSRETTDRPLEAAGWMVLASFFFALMTILARLGSTEVPWLEVALARSFFGLLVAVGVARARGLSLTVQKRGLAWGRSLAGTVAVLCTFYSIAAPELSLGDATSLRSTTPIFLAIFAPWFLGERSDWSIWVATPVAFLGVVLLAEPTFHGASLAALVSILAAVAAAVAMMFLRRLGHGETPEAVAAHFSMVATIVLFLFAAPGFVLPAPAAALYLAATGLSAGLGQLTMTRAYALDRAARVGTVGYIGVVMTQILGVLFLSEIPDARQISGSALVIGAGIVLTLAAQKRPA